MKQCPYCGLQNDDSARECVTCHTALPAQSSFPASAVKPVYGITPQEARFWEHMTFHKFAILLVKLQGVWWLFSAVVELTYLPRYISNFLMSVSYSAVSTGVKREAALMVLRLVLYAGAGLGLILYAERFLSWLIRDSVTRQGFSSSPAPVALTANVSKSPEPPGSGSRSSV